MARTWTKLTFYGVAALLVVCIAGSAAAAPGEGAQLRKVTIAMIGVDAAAQAMYAKHRGFFRRQGIEAELMVVADGTLTIPAVLSGQAQFAAAPSPVVATLRANNAPVRAVAGGAVYEPRTATTVLVAAPRKPFTRARDLRGKRIGVDFLNSIAHIGVLRWLSRGGVSKEDVNFTTASFPQLLGPLLRGQLDAALLPEPYVTAAIRRGARRVALPFDAVCTRECLLTAWIARKDVDADLVARYRNAIQTAAVWANQKRNQAASGRILSRYAPIEPAVLRTMTRTRYATRLRPCTAQPWIDLWAEYDLLPDGVSACDLVK
jgi:NitT/TauT family transport system substrate-binding protein